MITAISLTDVRFNMLLDCISEDLKASPEMQSFNPKITINKINEMSRDRVQSSRITRFVDIIMTLPFSNLLTDIIMELPTTNVAEFQSRLANLINEQVKLSSSELAKLNEKIKNMIENKIPQLSAFSTIDVVAFLFSSNGRLKDKYYVIMGMSTLFHSK